jgi:Uma2 family endonuclease
MDHGGMMADDRRDTDMSAREHIYTMTVPEYVRATQVLGWERTELIEGIVYTMPAEKNRHWMTVETVRNLLAHAFPAHVVTAAGSVQLGDDSLVNPDVFVVDSAQIQDLDDFARAPAVLLVVEVSVSTLYRDRGPKLLAYAKAAIPEVWVIDPRPKAGTLLRHTDPQEDGRYTTVQSFDVGECAEKLDIDKVRA